MGTLPFEAAAAASAEQHFAKRRRALANETRELQAVEGKRVNGPRSLYGFGLLGFRVSGLGL